MISVIIRAKNEEAWIRRCLFGVKTQQVDHEVEVVLVDNMSTDLTVAKAQSVWPDLTLVTIEEFLPGRALNLGIEAARGDLIVCLSAHCIPVDDQWLAALARNLEDGVAGVYGRQLPTASTSPSDRRDLTIVFGLDRKVQRKDPFFHNANSMMPRAVLNEFRFRDDVTNIEDRLWAEQVLRSGMTITYEPDAQVFHHHGIHHGRDDARARNTVQVLRSAEVTSDGAVEDRDRLSPQLKIVGILPVGDSLGNIEPAGLGRLLEAALASVEESELLDSVFVSAASEVSLRLAKSVGFEVQAISNQRPVEGVGRFDDVLRYELDRMESTGCMPDGILSFDLSHPIRPPRYFDNLIREYATDQSWSVCAGFPEYRPAWIQDGQEFARLDQGHYGRTAREPLWVAIPSLGCISTPSQIRSGRRLGEVTRLLHVASQIHRYEVRTTADLLKVEEFLRL